MTRSSELSDIRRAHLHGLVNACPEMTRLAELVRDFAGIMADRRGAELDCWIKQAREVGLPELEPFLRGLDQDHDAAVAGLTLPHQRPLRRSQYENEAPETTNVRTSRIPAPSTSNPAGVEQNPTPPEVHKSQISDSPG